MKSRKHTLGRYNSPKYIAPIKDKFKEQFPDSVPKDFIIDHVLKYFFKYVETELKNDREVQVFSYGTFSNRSGMSPRTKKLQYYPKFKFSRHFILRLREHKGTATEAELREIETKHKFMSEVWNKRNEHTMNKRGKLPDKIQNYNVPIVGNSIDITTIN